MTANDPRQLGDLAGVGPATLDDFRLLEVESVSQLATENPAELYERLKAITRSRQDPCVLDVFHCAVAQAQDPDLPEEECRWWTWSRRRKQG